LRVPATIPEPAGRDRRQLRVVLFSGGRGSGVLTRQLVANSSVALTIAINGYDDGASTGEVRRFLRDSLGPSDFRKNASRLATELRSCPPSLIELLDLRFPVGAAEGDARRAFAALRGDRSADSPEVHALASALDAKATTPIGAALEAFEHLLTESGEPFNFSDCSLGNLVFAGIYLQGGRDFNRAVDDYSALVGLPIGLIENVTDGTNAWLVGIDSAGRLLATEEELVDGTRPHRVVDIFLITRLLSVEERTRFERSPDDVKRLLESLSEHPALNARLEAKIAAADLIIYAPGTQHSSLFPSYLTPGLAAAIAGNLSAIKLLITNIQSDAEITGSNAVDIIDRAVFYLKEKGRVDLPTPCLITHYLVNDPEHGDAEKPYVPLGPLDSIEDPRLVRIGYYEEGVTGRHDAARVLAPFIDALLAPDDRRRVAVLLHDAGSTNKSVQSMLEMVRGGIARVPLDVTVFHAGDELDARVTSRLPFAVTRLPAGDASFAAAAKGGAFDYVALFESSGMYRGEDLVALVSHLVGGRLDAVWGSRRLSVRDIEQSYRLRYRNNMLMGAISHAGSYLLSVAYLALYRRYISDTLSAVRAVRARDAFGDDVDLTDKSANHLLLTRLLRRQADILEIPVRFFPMSPDRVKRTSPWEGLQALGIIVWRRFAGGGNDASTSRPTEPVGERTAESSVRSSR
jgi:2-phospho-L-lactate transferase/gluconeogenesis factor (CofD/UPF0052 family)